TFNAWLYDGGTIAQSRTFGLDHLPYVFGGDVTVAPAATLTVVAGAVLKFATGHQLTVNGALSAIGTATRPIIFTSRRDDTALGDTFNDPDNAPQRGDWHGIVVDDAAGAVSLDYVELR